MIRMIAGVYGLSEKRADGSTHIKAMGPNSGPFTVTPEKEARLVRLGVAEYVTATAAEDVSVGMSAKKLRDIGKEYGLTFRVGMTKAEMVEAIKAAQNPAEDDESEPEQETETEPELPESGEIEGEESEVEDDAPTFDASDAVQ